MPAEQAPTGQLLSEAVLGGRPSMANPPTVTPDAWLPARSRAGSLVTDRSAPLPATTFSLGQVATPERASVHANRTVTSPRYQPEAPAGSVAAPVISGAVRSMLIPDLVAVVRLPARSATDTGPATRSAPSPVSTVGSGRLAGSGPERPSWATQSSVTSPRYQPAASGAVVGSPTRVGGVRSMLIPSTVVLAVLPARSAAAPGTLWSAPASARVVPGSQAARPLSWSVQSNRTVTGSRCQPLAFAAGLTTPRMVGSRTSIGISTRCPISVLSTLPATSSLQ